MYIESVIQHADSNYSSYSGNKRRKCYQQSCSTFQQIQPTKQSGSRCRAYPYCTRTNCSQSMCWVQNPHLVNNPTKRSQVDVTLNYKQSTNQQNDDCSLPCSTKLLTGTGRIIVHDEAQQHEDECTAITEHWTDLFNPETHQSAQEVEFSMCVMY